MKSLEENLYHSVINTSHQEYPSPKTIERAFVTNKRISEKLFDICGWYVYEKNWKTERPKFINTNENSPSEKPKTQDKNTFEQEEITLVEINETSFSKEAVEKLLRTNQIEDALKLLEPYVKEHKPKALNTIASFYSTLTTIEQEQMDGELNREDANVAYQRLKKRIRMLLKKL